MDVAFLPENNILSDASLPLFERSLVDPESPALNEDGEFPEFDLNVIYNTEILRRLNLRAGYLGDNVNFNSLISSEQYGLKFLQKKRK
jgi:hypothetical protein